MKKSRIAEFLLVLCCIAISFSGSGVQEIQVFHHTYYTSYFSSGKHIPIVVEYILTRNMVSCANHIKRKNNFAPDPMNYDLTNLQRDYKGSGFDRGHNMSAADNSCDENGMKECFYFSNMTPQPHGFNAGRWEETERLERSEAEQYDSLTVTVGSIGKAGVIGIDEVVVPSHMWKVIFIHSQKKYECYYFPNSADVKEPLASYKKSVTEIENLGKVKFKNGNVSLTEQ